MEIIKRGIPPNERTWTGTCHKCKSEAEAKEAELRVQNYQREGGQFAWAKCPVCGAGDSEGYGGMLFYPKK